MNFSKASVDIASLHICWIKLASFANFSCNTENLMLEENEQQSIINIWLKNVITSLKDTQRNLIVAAR